MRMLTGVILAALLSQPACGGSKEGAKPMALELTSPAFMEGGAIPEMHTCDGADVSPALAWSGAPDRTKSFALICDDPDSPTGTWVHWVLYHIPATSDSLPEGVPKERTVPGIGEQGKNDFKRVGYGGPCPPRGKPHRYFFKLYALDFEPALEPGIEKKDLEKALKGHILAEGQLMGRYRR